MADNKSSVVSAAKATLIGGAVFLIPGFLAFFVLGKVFGILRTLAVTLGEPLGITGKLGHLLLDIAAIAAVLLVCFLGGLLARRTTARRLRTKVDQMLLGSIPGYAFVKGVAENVSQSEEMATSFLPVLVKFDDYWQVAFETHRMAEGIVAVYLPGAPNPWSGSTVFVTGERVRALPVSVAEALKITRALGRGSETLAEELRTVQDES